MTQSTARTLSHDDDVHKALTPDDMRTLQATFAEEGYVVLRNVVPKDKLAHLRGRILEEFDRARRSNLFHGGGNISGHLNSFPGEESRFAYEALRDYGVIDLVRAISPKSVGEPNVGCNLNLPGSVAQHYHADSNYFTEDFMVVNVAVVDTDLVNGAIDVVPKTHKKYYKYWRFAVERPYRAAKRIPMQQGDVLIRTSNLWHRGMPNRSSVPRPMVAFTWEMGGSTAPDPFKVEGGKIVFRPNWFRPTRLGRLRERTFVTAPFTYSAYRIVSSLVADKLYTR
jgi:ectoine hydroxylase-related dioxygenase (phytanoyl-CoA dioxygenase family)